MIRTLYDETKIKLSMRIEKGGIKNTIGVKQGNTIAAV
jgi:hypothetical protein